MSKDKFVWAFRIVGKECGRDISGTFYCNCGKCRPLRVDVGSGGKYRGDDCCDGRYDGEEHIEYFPPLGSSGTGFVGFDQDI